MQGVRPKQVAGEGVDGVDGGIADLIARARAKGPLLVCARGPLCDCLEGFAHAGPQLRRCRLSEGDSYELSHRDAPVGNELGNPFDDGRRLARSRPGIDEQGAVEVCV